MGLLGRTKIFFDAQMKLNGAALKPASAAFGELGRLSDLGHSEQDGVESAGCVFTVWRHGELDMIDGQEVLRHGSDFTTMHLGQECPSHTGSAANISPCCFKSAI